MNNFITNSLYKNAHPSFYKKGYQHKIKEKRQSPSCGTKQTALNLLKCQNTRGSSVQTQQYLSLHVFKSGITEAAMQECFGILRRGGGIFVL